MTSLSGVGCSWCKVGRGLGFAGQRLPAAVASDALRGLVWLGLVGGVVVALVGYPSYQVGFTKDWGRGGKDGVERGERRVAMKRRVAGVPCGGSGGGSGGVLA
ncbi:hypothetical protein PLESTF_000060900 [Pleodorina starrii]|nr:hypothetical protein PLESTF_000060900 [Pleodorina starrii]